MVLVSSDKAIHGTTPSFAKSNVGTYVLFCVAPIQFNFDWKTGNAKLASSGDKLNKIGKFVDSMVVLSMLLSVLVPRSYNLFPRKEIVSFSDLFYWGNICNNYVLACKSSSYAFASSMSSFTARSQLVVIYQLYVLRLATTLKDLTGRSLESGTLAVGIMTEFATGLSVMELSNAPLTKSRSPSDFWGRRWNSLGKL